MYLSLFLSLLESEIEHCWHKAPVKYSFANADNIVQPIQTSLAQKSHFSLLEVNQAILAWSNRD